MASGFSFTDKGSESLKRAIALAQENSHVQVGPVHIALALLEESTGKSGTTEGLFSSVLDKAGIDPKNVNRALQKRLVREPSQEPAPADVGFGAGASKVLREAQKCSKQQNDSFIAQDHLILGLLEDAGIKSALEEAGVRDFRHIRNAISTIRGGRQVNSKNAEENFEALKKYSTDMTQMAADGKYDPVIGRDNEIRRCIRILCRRTKNNPVLIGEPGVGKSAIAEGLAQRIVNRDVPASLIGRIFSIDLGAIEAGASYKGQVEERVKSILDEIEKASKDGQNIIVFVDELHMIMAGQGKGGGMDIANLIKPALARGQLRMIGATTLTEYRKYIEKDAASERRFQQVLVNEPTVPETISILRGLKEKYESHHGVTVLDSAIVSAAQLAHRYLTSRKLPDSAIDLVDEAAAAVRVTRDSQPEQVDRLERKKLQLEVEAHALTKEKDAASKERAQEAQREIASIDDQLKPLKADWEAQKGRGEEIRKLRDRVDKLKVKLETAERSHDVGSAADLRHYAIPDLMSKLEELEKRKQTSAGSELEADTVTADAIAEIVARWTGIPVTRLKASEKSKLLRMEKGLMKEVVGQPEAVKAVANAIRLSRSGLANEARPVASFLFCGPSGTGKTLLTKALARFLFDDPDAICRIDASEYTEKHSISRLIGSPPGYVGHEEGGQLTEWVRRRPYSIVLIDEIEKAAREFTTLFLQVLDDGRLTDSQGRVVSFRNTVIIMTSNLGAQYLDDAPEGEPIPPATKELVQGAIRRHFVPEFINRIDEIVIFQKLGREQVRAIVEVRLAECQKRLNANGKNITLVIDDSAKDWLGARGYNPLYGARPLNRAIQQELLHPLSQFLLNDQIRDGENARISADFRRNCLVIHANHQPSIKQLDEDEDEEMDVDGEGLD